MTTYDDVYSAALSWYRPRLRRIVDSAILACNTERCDTTDPGEFLTEWVNVACDCNLSQCSGPASAVLLASNNDEAYYVEYDEHGSTFARAFWALRADVWDLLLARAEEWQ